MKRILSLLLVMIVMMMVIGCSDNANVEEAVNTTNSETVENTDTAVEETTTEEVEVVEEVAYYPITFTDGMGREVTITEEPMRVISLAPSMTEMIYAVGAGEKLIGRTDYCNYPEEVLNVESVGSLRNPNIEGIVALNPDLILMSTHASEEVLAKFEEAGLNTAILIAQEDFGGVYEIVTQTGMIFNKVAEAEAVADKMKKDVEEVLNTVKDVEKKSVYYVVGFGEYGDYTATGDTFIHELLEMAGGTNIASDGTSWSYNLESIIAKDPEYIICSELSDTKATLEITDGYKDLTAVKEGRLIEINQDLLSRQGPRMAEGLKLIAKILHPELFN